MKIEIACDVRCRRWSEGDVRAIRRAIRTTLQQEILDTKRAVAVSLVLSDNDQVQELNLEWRKKDKPTNVLSFPTEALKHAADYPRQIALPLGDLILAHETCADEAKSFGIKPSHYASFLAIHGTLHLLGYDHEIDADHEIMMRAELAVLTQLGLANPYPFMQNNKVNA